MNQVISLRDDFGVQIVNFDFNAPRAGAILVSHLRDAHLVVLRGPEISPEMQVRITHFFGDPVSHEFNAYGSPRRAASRVAGNPELYYLSNLGDDGRPNGKFPDVGTHSFHHDTSWRANVGFATLLYAIEVPAEGGFTVFSDMHAVLRAMPKALRDPVRGRFAEHSLEHSRNRYHPDQPFTEQHRRSTPPAPHPILCVHPENNRPAVYLGDHARTIHGISEEEGQALITDINEFAARNEFVFAHTWEVNDLLIWDNRSVLHRATEYDTLNSRRVLRRSTTASTGPLTAYTAT